MTGKYGNEIDILKFEIALKKNLLLTLEEHNGDRTTYNTEYIVSLKNEIAKLEAKYAGLNVEANAKLTEYVNEVPGEKNV